ncbi:MAG TPA: sigma-70 family RNA polymerase sigma factor [Chitinophagaceae bacterium]|nr:sigma-70 family RNA polymerase sigma factor [Chitinophagaceae bacterium]
MQTALTDIELWNAFKQGDRIAFTNLFKRYYPVLIQYGSRFCVETDLLEDSVQELFIELWQTNSLSEIQSVKAYLFKSLKYKIFKLMRRKNHVTELVDDMAFEISHENFLINLQDDRQQIFRIIQAINQLPNRQKEIVYLKLYHQLSYEELSVVMQINYQAARNLFYQAIKSLRKVLS